MTTKLIIASIAGIGAVGGASAGTYCYYNCKSKAAQKAEAMKQTENNSGSSQPTAPEVTRTQGSTSAGATDRGIQGAGQPSIPSAISAAISAKAV